MLPWLLAERDRDEHHLQAFQQHALEGQRERVPVADARAGRRPRPPAPPPPAAGRCRPRRAGPCSRRRAGSPCAATASPNTASSAPTTSRSTPSGNRVSAGPTTADHHGQHGQRDGHALEGGPPFPGQAGRQHDRQRLDRLHGAGHEDGQDKRDGIHVASSGAGDGTALLRRGVAGGRASARMAAWLTADSGPGEGWLRPHLPGSVRAQPPAFGGVAAAEEPGRDLPAELRGRAAGGPERGTGHAQAAQPDPGHGRDGGAAVLRRVLAGEPEVRAAFEAARNDEYEEIVDRCEDFLAQVKKEYVADHFTSPSLRRTRLISKAAELVRPDPAAGRVRRQRPPGGREGAGDLPAGAGRVRRPGVRGGRGRALSVPSRDHRPSSTPFLAGTSRDAARHVTGQLHENDICQLGKVTAVRSAAGPLSRRPRSRGPIADRQQPDRAATAARRAALPRPTL